MLTVIALPVSLRHDTGIDARAVKFARACGTPSTVENALHRGRAGQQAFHQIQRPMLNLAKDMRYALPRSRVLSAAGHRLPFVFAMSIGPCLDGLNTPGRADICQFARRKTEI